MDRVAAASILLIDSSASDSALMTVLLQREMPAATIVTVADAAAFAGALAGSPASVAIVSAGLTWSRLDDLVGAIRRRNPATAVVLFGEESDLVARALDPGLACDGIVRKGSAGFLGLIGIVNDVLARTARTAVPEAAAAAAVPGTSRGQQELRDIALMFSHDLQEPLQQIVRLARVGQATDDARVSARSLQRVTESATRAGGMLDGMLEYLRVTGRDAAPALVDLNSCLSQATENLRTSIDESQAVVSAARLPAVMGDEHQLLHLVQNLLSNAIKFRGRERPYIDISVDARGDQWLLAFRDNGIGIAQPFLERIFTMGQRLHTREEYPGTGLGLALCRRIVERHGGRIWAESTPGSGSTFFVSLPRPTPAGSERSLSGPPDGRSESRPAPRGGSGRSEW